MELIAPDLQFLANICTIVSACHDKPPVSNCRLNIFFNTLGSKHLQLPESHYSLLLEYKNNSHISNKSDFLHVYASGARLDGFPFQRLP
jgi:hypothetical protein